MNKVVFFLLWMTVLGCDQPARAQSDPVRQLWMQQYTELKADIEACQAGKRLASPFLLDRQSAVYMEDRFVCDIVLRRTAALLEDLQSQPNASELNGFEKDLADLKKRCEKSTTDRQDLYLEICALRRKIALSNPLLDFDEMIFVTKQSNIEGVLQCWNYGYGADSGGGLFKISGIKSDTQRIDSPHETERGIHQGQLAKRTGKEKSF